MTIDVKFQELNSEFNADFENTEQSFGAEFGQIIQVVIIDHRKLQHREDANQHPTSAITGLEKALIDKLNKTDLPTAINTALAQAKASGEFDGEDGADGKDGTNGKDGEDGYTPIKGTDYFTESDKIEMVNAVISALPVYNGEVETV